ncbi:MAG: TIGR00266 family protein [Polyangiaceae bacterium]|nr:TIGR00266 family protein [Polyangiaceae bacterium]
MQVTLLHRPSYALARCALAPGERVIAERGAMVAMSASVRIEPRSGGLLSGLRRMLGAEASSRSALTAAEPGGEVLLAPPLPGDMAVLEVGARRWCVQSSAYVASGPAVEVRTRSGAGFFWGAGLFVLEASGEGQLLIGAYGALEELPVAGGMVIDTGHLAAWDARLRCEVESGGAGWLSSWLSGEGLVCRFEGEGSVWLQSRNVSEYGTAVGAKLPPRRG